MSTSAVSASPLNQQIQQYFHTRQTDLQQLGQALGNGDLTGAQAAFQQIAKLGQGGPFANGNPFLNSQREQEFTAIGNALQSGDLAGAQQAFSDLKASFQNQSGRQNPIADPLLPATPPSSPAVGPEIVIDLSSSSTANPEQISININPTSGGGEQISLSVGQQGANPQLVSFNLAPNSNQEIVLNLLGASPTTTGSASGTTLSGTASPSTNSSPSTTSGGLSVSA